MSLLKIIIALMHTYDFVHMYVNINTYVSINCQTYNESKEHIGLPRPNSLNRNFTALIKFKPQVEFQDKFIRSIYSLYSKIFLLKEDILKFPVTAHKMPKNYYNRNF